MVFDIFRNTPNNSDFARVVGDDGSVPAAAIRLPNDQVKPLADNIGRLIVNTIPYTPGFPVLHQVTAGTGAAFESAVISATPAELVAIAGYNADTANKLYVWICDQVALPPVNPIIIIPVPAEQPFSYSLPVRFAFGICIGISTTEFAYAGTTQLASMVAIYRAAT